MIRSISALAILLLLAQPGGAQALDPNDPFRVVRSELITISTHLGDGRIEDRQGVRFAVLSDWTHTDAEMAAYVDLIIGNLSRFTSDPAIIKLMADGDLLNLVVDFYRGSEQGVVQKMMYFKDTRRLGWEQLERSQQSE